MPVTPPAHITLPLRDIHLPEPVGWCVITSYSIHYTKLYDYSLSAASRQYLQQLREPLLIRGYFSAKTHPLLAPLVPRLRDLIREYQIAGDGKVRAEFVDRNNFV